jgi:hypothetical protein
MLGFFVGFPVVWLVAAGLGFGSEYLKDVGVIPETIAVCVACAGALGLFAWVIWSFIQSVRELRHLGRLDRR